MKDENEKLREILAYTLLLQTVGPYMGAARCASMARNMAPGINVEDMHALMLEQEKASIGCCAEAPVRNTVDSIVAQCMVRPKMLVVDPVSNL